MNGGFNQWWFKIKIIDKGKPIFNKASRFKY